MGRKNNSRKRPFPGSNHRQNDVQNNSNNTTTFFHPSMLAQQAAMMRNSSPNLGVNSPKNGMKDDTNKNVEKKKNKKQKLTKEKNSKVPTHLKATPKKSSTQQPPHHNKVRENTTSSERNKSNEKYERPSLITKENNSEHLLVMFNNIKWRRSEQLVRLVSYNSFPIEFHQEQQDDIALGENYLMKVVFFGEKEDDLVKNYASLLKPILHPNISFACHGKVKRHQIQSIIHQIKLKHNDINFSHVVGSSILLVPDSSARFLASVINKSTPQNKAKGRSINNTELQNHNTEKMIKVVKILPIHFHAPADDEAFQERCKVVQEFEKLFQPTFNLKGKNDQSCHPNHATSSFCMSHVILDGCDDNNTQLISPNYKLQHENLLHWKKSFVTGSNLSNDNSKPSNYVLKAQNLNIPSSDRSKCQAIVNSAFKLFQLRKTSGESCDGETAARRKLMAHLITIEQSSNQRCSKFSTNEIILRMQVLGMMTNDQPNSGQNEDICGSIFSENENHLTSLQNILKQQRSAKKARDTAWTCWLDRQQGKAYGGTWDGTVRQGASAEKASRQLAELLKSWKYSKNKKNKKNSLDNNHNPSCSWCALKLWSPNPVNEGHNRVLQNMIIDDTDRGGGNENDQNDDCNDFGDIPCAKACGHNETTMFFLRPFAALEVINSRVCSKQSPAPGNIGYEGCFEFLRRLCASNERGMTFWDTECFAFIDGTKNKGVKTQSNGLAPVYKLYKNDLLLSSLTTKQLSWIMIALRQWTTFRERHITGCHPKKLLHGILLAYSLALEIPRSEQISSETLNRDEKLKSTSTNGQEKIKEVFKLLSCRTMNLIYEFVLPGNPDYWRSLGPIIFQ